MTKAKKKKGLSDKELVEKYESGKQDMPTIVKKLINTNKKNKK